MSRQRSYEEQMAELDERLGQLKARRQALAARHGKDERKARDHALIVAGGMLVACFDGGWKTVDFKRLSGMIERNRTAFAKLSAPELATAEAKARLRAWETELRNCDENDGI